MASVRKRTWTVAGQERTAWVVDYFDQDGKRRLKTFERKKEADDYQGQVKHEVRHGIHTADSASLTLGQAADLWLDDCRAEKLERSTVNQRRQHIDLHIKPFLGSTKLSRLTSPMVRAFLNDLRDGGRSEAMRRKVFTNLKTILSFAQDTGLVAQNVARTGRRQKRKTRDEARNMDEGADMPTKAELRAIINGATDPWRPLLITAIFTGMRASELRGLKWENVDLEAGAIRVRERVDAWGVFGSPKSEAGVRDIPLAPLVVNTLRRWREDQLQRRADREAAAKEKGRSAPPVPLRDLVFPNGAGNAENHANIWKRGFAPLQVELGVTVDTGARDKDGKPILKPKYGLHALRHAAASLFIEQGWTPKHVQTVMGHASIAMTYDLYGKLFKDPEGDRKSMQQIEARLLLTA